jgi:hypothetical protein
VITGRQASCSSPATTDRHEHRPTQITAGRLRRSLAAPQHTPAPGRPGTYKRGTAGLSLLRRLSHDVALLSHCVTRTASHSVTRVCCRISLYGIKAPPAASHVPTGSAVVTRPWDRNHDTARGPTGRARSRAGPTATVPGRCAATAPDSPSLHMSAGSSYAAPTAVCNGAKVRWTGSSETGQRMSLSMRV